MTLHQLCDPIFDYVCCLNRSARNGAQLDSDGVRSRFCQLLEEAQNAAADDEVLSRQYSKVKMPLIFFIDSMVCEGGWNISSSWNEKRLASESNELAGDEKFFDLLDETLADNDREATDRLSIFYACVGLGFEGWYAGQPEYLRKKMKNMAARITDQTGTRKGSGISPEALEGIDTRTLVQPRDKKPLVLAIAAAPVLLLLVAGNIILYTRAGNQIQHPMQKAKELINHWMEQQSPK